MTYRKRFSGHDITGTEKKKLCQAIISAYPTKADLEIMVSDELEENLDAIAGRDNLTKDAPSDDIHYK